MKNRWKLVRLFCLALACMNFVSSGLTEEQQVLPEAIHTEISMPEDASFEEETIVSDEIADGTEAILSKETEVLDKQTEVEKEIAEEEPVPEETLAPEPTAAAEETALPQETSVPAAMPVPGSGSGSFCLAAYTEDKLLIAPMVVNFTVSDTIRDALVKVSGHTFIDLESGDISEIDGVRAAYSRIDEDGGYDLERYASEIEVLVFTDGSSVSQADFGLISVMAAYSDSAEAKNNDTAKAVYQEILAEYLTLSDEDAAEWTDRLKSAMKDEDISAGDPNAPEMIDGVFHISTGGEMKWFADHTGDNPSANAMLTGDISLSGIAWMPIGSESIPYIGSFDGCGHKISGLSISASGNYQALFGYTGVGAEVKNLTVSGNVDAGGSYTAGIIAYSEASVSNLHNLCKVTSSGQYIGGVVGAFGGKGCSATGCTNSGTVYAANASGAAYVGGILGGREGNLIDCSNSGSVSGYSYVGGIAGQAGNLTDCVNSGEIQCVSQYAGGIAGKASTVSSCKNSGTVSASGVFVESKQTYDASYIGGVAGQISEITNCVNRGKIVGRTAQASDFSSVGGVAGKATQASDCLNYGTVTVSGSYVAGVIGGNAGHSVLRCANFASVSNLTAEGKWTGGVASTGKLEECFNVGAVKGSRLVGGVVGGTSDSSAKYCYNLAHVSGKMDVGGIAGECLIVAHSYNCGEVSVSGNSGGLIAAVYSNVSESWYLDSLSLYSKAGTPLDRSGMRLAMCDAAAFELNLNEDYHGGYPCLKWEQADVSAAVTAIRLPEGEKKAYSMLRGGELPRLPAQVVVTAGGLDFLCAVEWKAPEDFDAWTAGQYKFVPTAQLPEACCMAQDTQKESITVSIMVPEDLPELTKIALEDGTKTQYTTVFGKDPEGLPDFAMAEIDGVSQRVAVEWIQPDNLDLTNTEAEFVYTMRLMESFAVAEDVQFPTITLRVQPMMLIEQLLFTEKKSAESAPYILEYQGMEKVDGVETFRYRMSIFDSSRAAYLHAQPCAEWAETVNAGYTFNALIADPMESSGELSFEKVNTLYNFVAGNAAYVGENRLTITAGAEIEGEMVEQIYVIDTVLQPTLKSVQVMNGDTQAYLTPAFDGRWHDYAAQIPANTEAVVLNLTTTMIADQLDGLTVAVDDETVLPNDQGQYSITVPTEQAEKNVSVKVSCNNGSAAVYTIRLARLQETLLHVNCTPESAKINISNELTGTVYANEDGSFTLIRSFAYDYTVSSYGYLSAAGTLTAEVQEMELTVCLEPAESNPDIKEDIESEWSGFRGDESNNAVSGSSTPITASDAVLYWANQAGFDYGSDAISSPILVDGYLVCTAKRNIFKIDTITGEVAQVGDMIKKSAFNITPPTYAKGMIFVALADGVVQAFNAETLESLWVYSDALGGQPNSPITYKDGYIYTGFWNGEVDDGNWVCLSVTDENPAKMNEAKKASWTYSQRGGFYWAGACVRDNFMIVGTDDGEIGYTSSTANLLSMDPDTGRLIDCLTGIEADVRCSVCYDTVTDRFYFTTKGGYFYSVAVSDEGYFDRNSLKKLNLRASVMVEGMSSSTPVVYNGRAYVGVSGRSHFEAYGGHGIAVIDLEKWEIAYVCPTRGYPQASGLLTNAYENTGIVYIYFLENMTPGQMCVIRDCPGQTQMLSIYDGSPIEAAEVLFTPRGAQRQYALGSPIVDEYGTFYFTNDSGHMMALGSRVVSLEVVQQPDKLLYEEGEVFDGTGLKVVQHLANGVTRDITYCVSWSEEPLKATDTDITIYFDYVRYNNDAEVLDKPQTAVNLTVLASSDMEAVRSVAEGINALGEITIESGEAICMLRAAYDALPLAQQELITNYETLTRAEEAWKLLENAEKQAAEETVRLIDAIGDVAADSADTIRSAFERYNGLSGYGKALVTNYALLQEKQAVYGALIETEDDAAYAVMTEIASLGGITAQSGSTLYALRDRYDSLPEASKLRVTNLSMLTAAEEFYARLIEETGEKSRLVIEMIEAIGMVTLEKEAAILRAREAYDALDEAAKAAVTNAGKLLTAQEQLAQLKQQLDGLGEITANLDNIVIRMQTLAADETLVNAQNAADLAPLIQQIFDMIGLQPDEDKALLNGYAKLADLYRIAVESCVHEDAETGVKAEGLEWYQQLKVETLTTSTDADYNRFKTLIAPQRVIKLYRVTIVDMIKGQQDANHASMELKWTIPVPRYNESSYSAIGVVHIGDVAAAQYLESSYANNNRSLKFATRGDGLIGVGGTKAQMNAAGSVSGSGSVLGGVTGSGSVLDEQPSSGNSYYPEYTYGGTAGMNHSVNYSDAQSAVLNQYGSAVETGEWYYRDVVVIPALLAELTDAQVNLYAEMSRAVENGTNRFFGYAVTPEEFEQVYAVYRLSNPLSALAEMIFTYEDGMVEVDFALSEDAHFKAVESWRARTEEIVNYCLIQGDTELSAARIYQYLAQTLIVPAAEWTPAEDDAMAAFWPGPYYALMNNRVSENDAAKVYAYLLMQIGLDCMIVQETPDKVVPEEPEQEAIPHVWTVLWQGWLYTHADLEMDLYREDAPEVQRDSLGHFGMSDEERAESVNAQKGYTLIVPECMLGEEGEEQRFIVPECSEALSGYAQAEAEPVEEIVEEVEE